MRHTTTGSVTWMVVCAALVAGGCSDDEAETTAAGPSATSTSSQSTGGSGGAGGMQTGGAPPALEVLASFDAATGELPEGLALRDDNAYVGFATLGAVVSVSTMGGEPASYAQATGLPADNVFLTGLTFDAQGQLYAAVPSFVMNPAPGVYRAPAGGGDATLFATDAAMFFPSGLEFDAQG
ncbi:MAG TPA: hypothetical protein VFB62_27030, partial [Polyangiaceae bacterium]|nr:hypothetical protein [Polyangiaceae bacterium]